MVEVCGCGGDPSCYQCCGEGYIEHCNDCGGPVSNCYCNDCPQCNGLGWEDETFELAGDRTKVCQRCGGDGQQ